MNCKLSVCLPAHRTHLWERLYNSISDSVGEEYTWELILVGPNDPPNFFEDKKNFKFFKDFGSPSRCFQLSTMLAEGELITWASDDGFYTKNSLNSCIHMHEKLGEKGIVIVRHVEGTNHSGKEEPLIFWYAHHHPTLRLKGISDEHYIILNGMMKTKFFRELGGVDCRYENYNMNLHDFAFRAQRSGCEIEFSKMIVLNCDWNPSIGDHVPVSDAHNQHDYPLFFEEFSKDQSNRINIDYFNWMFSDKVWKRRFGDLK